MRSARVFEGITDTGSLSWQQCFSWLESFIFHKHKSWDINITKTVPTFLPDAFFQEIYTLASGTLTPKGMELLSNDYAEERKNCFPSDRDQRRRWTWSQVGIQWEFGKWNWTLHNFLYPSRGLELHKCEFSHSESQVLSNQNFVFLFYFIPIFYTKVTCIFPSNLTWRSLRYRMDVAPPGVLQTWTSIWAPMLPENLLFVTIQPQCYKNTPLH